METGIFTHPNQPQTMRQQTYNCNLKHHHQINLDQIHAIYIILIIINPMSLSRHATRFLVRRTLFKIKPVDYSSIISRARFTASDFRPICSRLQPITDTSSRKHLFSSRTMATQSTPPQSVHGFTVKVSFLSSLISD